MENKTKLLLPAVSLESAQTLFQRSNKSITYPTLLLVGNYPSYAWLSDNISSRVVPAETAIQKCF